MLPTTNILVEGASGSLRLAVAFPRCSSPGSDLPIPGQHTYISSQPFGHGLLYATNARRVRMKCSSGPPMPSQRPSNAYESLKLGKLFSRRRRTVWEVEVRNARGISQLVFDGAGPCGSDRAIGGVYPQACSSLLRPWTLELQRG